MPSTFLPSFSPCVDQDSSSTTRTICATEFSDTSAFQDYLGNRIQDASTSQILVVTEIDISLGAQTVQLIKTRCGRATRIVYNSATRILRVLIMITHLHNCVQDWWHLTELAMQRTGELTMFEQLQIRMQAGTSFKFDSGPYNKSEKEPDFSLLTAEDKLPSFVIESGFGESHRSLMDDMNLLLVGGDGHINAVVIIDWRKSGDLVRGTAELYVRDRDGMPSLRQTEVVFPAPQSSTPQRIALTRRELFGRRLTPDPERLVPPGTMVYLDINHLRQVATEAMQRMSLRPA